MPIRTLTLAALVLVTSGFAAGCGNGGGGVEFIDSICAPGYELAPGSGGHLKCERSPFSPSTSSTIPVVGSA